MHTDFKVLYKMDAFGRIVFWQIVLSGSSVDVKWGLLEQLTKGALFPLTCSSGNETHEEFSCGESVAESEAIARARFESMCLEKINRKGYSLSIPKTVPALPMLAKVFTEDPGFTGYAIQPKMDGFRCIGWKTQMRSRYNSLIRAVPHIQEALKALPPGVKLDGELYLHGLDLQTISSYVKRDSPHKMSKLIEYHVFDIIMDAPFIDRQAEIRKIFIDFFPDPSSPVKEVPTLFEDKFNEAVFKKHHDNFTSKYYEGIMIRDVQGMYEYNKRSNGLLKYKQFTDGAFLIKDVVEAKNGCAVLVCETHGTTTEVALAYNRLQSQMVLVNRNYHIGRWARIKYQKQLPSGKLFQPHCTEIFTKEKDFHVPGGI